jgi:hypothetical protein
VSNKATAAPAAPLAPKSAEAIADNIKYQTSKTGVMPLTFDVPDMYRATAESVNEQLMENWQGWHTLVVLVFYYSRLFLKSNTI